MSENRLMNRKPRVLQLCHDYKGPFRTVTRQYAGCFADCDVRTVFLRGTKSTQLAESIPGEVDFLMLERGALSGLKLDAAAQLETLIGSEVPDIVIAHRYKPFYLSMLLNRRMELGLVLGVMHEYGFLRRRTRSFFSRFWGDNVYLIGVSEPVCEEIRQAQPRLSGRVHQVPHAIEAGTLLDSVSARHQLGVPLGTYCYGVIGRLVHKKNHELLINALARLDDHSVLAIIGGGELEKDLVAQAARLGLAERVIFCGHHDDARTLLKAFDSFVLPSTEEEAFGMVLLEAMAASVPVLTSDAPGPASVVGDTARMFRCGNLEDLTEQMKQMQSLSQPDERELTGLALDRLGARFSLTAQRRKIRNLPMVDQLAPESTGK